MNLLLGSIGVGSKLHSYIVFNSRNACPSVGHFEEG